MAIFSANVPTKIVAIHKEHCHKIPREKLKACGCGETGKHGNQRWFCEQHINLDEIDEFMNHRHWVLVICDVCFRE